MTRTLFLALVSGVATCGIMAGTALKQAIAATGQAHLLSAGRNRFVADVTPPPGDPAKAYQSPHFQSDSALDSPCTGGVPRASTSLTSCAPNTDGAWFEIPGVGRRDFVTVGAYDSRRERLLIVGGDTDIWQLSFGDFPEWQAVCAVGTGPERTLAVAIDSLHDRIFCYGINRLPTRLEDIWELSLGPTPTWRRLGLPELGLFYIVPSLNYDPVQNQLLLFANLRERRKVWSVALDGPTNPPELINDSYTDAVGGEAAIYDSRGNRLVVFGGYREEFYEGRQVYYYNSVYQLRPQGDAAWERISVVGEVPSGRFASAIAWDPVRSQLLIGGGANENALNDAWALDVSSARWTRLTTMPSPMTPFDNRPGFYDSGRSEFVVFGKYPLDAIWEFPLDGGEVRPRVAAVSSPPEREEAAAIYDPTEGRIVAHGGGRYWGAFNGETWTANVLTEEFCWAQLRGEGPEVQGHTGIYDAASNRMVIYGGVGSGFVPSDEIWALPLSGSLAWQKIDTSLPAPAAREGHVAVYEPFGRRMIVYGGGTHGIPALPSDVWAFSFADHHWSQLNPSGQGPGGRDAGQAVYDPDRHRMIFFGGWAPFEFQNDAWELSLGSEPQWQQIVPQGQGPDKLVYHSAVFDETRGRVVVVSYRADGLSSVWELSLRDPPTWRRLEPWGKEPILARHVTVYDSENDRMIAVLLGRTFLLDWGRPALSVSIDVRPGSPVGAGARRGDVRLNVAILGAPGFVTRDIEPGSLSLLGKGIEQGGPGHSDVQFHDLNRDGLEDLIARFAVPEARFTRPDGRVVLRGQLHDARWFRGVGQVNLRPAPLSVHRSEGFGTAKPALKVSLLSGNPVRGKDLRLSIAVATEDPVTIDCVDVAGRRVFRERLGGLSEGAHEIGLSKGLGWRPGIYFLRVVQGTLSDVIRLAIMD